ncbi:MAG TPA: hypothetical protein IAC84_04135 [Firmicutes bacterium]|nr:hypothetical protein [Bacillota bacterium]
MLDREGKPMTWQM